MIFVRSALYMPHCNFIFLFPKTLSAHKLPHEEKRRIAGNAAENRNQAEWNMQTAVLWRMRWVARCPNCPALASCICCNVMFTYVCPSLGTTNTSVRVSSTFLLRIVVHVDSSFCCSSWQEFIAFVDLWRTVGHPSALIHSTLFVIW